MNAIELLKRQHREVDQLFNQFERALDAPNSKHAIFELIADTLRAHAEIEEQIFYPAARYRKTASQIERSFEDHKQVEVLISQTLEHQPTEPDYDTKARELRTAVQKHVREEEDQLFPRVGAQLGRLRLEELGDQMGELEKQIQARRSEAEFEQPAEGAAAGSESEETGVRQ